MSITLQRFSDLVAGVHEAGVDPDRWDHVIADITTVFGAEHGYLTIAEPSAHRATVRSADPDLADPVFRRLGRLGALVDRLPAGLTVTGDEVVTDAGEAAARSALTDGLANSFLARLTTDVPSSWICLAMPAGLAVSGCAAERGLLRVLVPHLRQALLAQSRLLRLTRERTIALATLEKAPYGILVVTAAGAVVFANSTALDILGRVDGLAVDRAGHVHAVPAARHAQLSKLIQHAASSEPTGGSVALPRPSGRRRLVVHVVPLDGIPTGDAEPSAVLLLVIDPDRDPVPPPDALHDLYGLTDTETLVALAVLHGDGLAAVAEELSVSLHTARTHLQHIFTKTGTHRQAELVRLLLTSSIAAG
ncbi:helix-turn-helix transcriptional regulator [Nocardia thailandica]